MRHAPAGVLIRAVAVAALLLFACRTRPFDVEAPDAGPVCCGSPGDRGNSIGVGRYCVTNADCQGIRPNACDTQSTPNGNFCTIKCAPDFNDCAEDATCDCSTMFSTLFHCTCVPTVCLPPAAACQTSL
jgi:hypothetical protein